MKAISSQPCRPQTREWPGAKRTQQPERRSSALRTVEFTVALLSRIQKVLGSNLGEETAYPGTFFVALSLQANAGMEPQSGYCRLLPHSFHFITHPDVTQSI
jgi:hypothetical protein